MLEKTENRTPGTPAAPPPLDGEQAALRRMEQRARALAQSHVHVGQAGAPSPLLDRLAAQEELLRSAHQTFAQRAAQPPGFENHVIYAFVAEWLLDNFYVVRQVFRQVREDMPSRYYRQLPKLMGNDLAGYPRIYAVARTTIQDSHARLDLEQVGRFVAAYQATTPLTMGELWALPTALRLGILDVLTHAVAQVLDKPTPGEPAARIAVAPDLPVDTVVGNAIHSLRALAVADWMSVFEDLSQVDRILRQDPAQTYDRMEFATRDQYRAVVEKLARAAGQDEVAVARTAVRLAADADANSRAGHVGFYLLAEGRPRLEAGLGYRPSLWKHLQRWPVRHPFLMYQGGIALLTAALLFLLAGYARAGGAGWPGVLLVGLFVLIPAVTIAVNLVNHIITTLTRPRLLPKLDFKDGIPPDCRAIVVTPALLTSAGEVDALLRQLELHYLRNADPNLSFALLTDWADAPEQHMPDDAALVERAAQGIRALNEHFDHDGGRPFYLFHRERRWNPAEGVWMGWERKRGKLEEFNRLILGDGATTYTTQVGRLDILPDIRYVITLDADTTLPRGSAARLVGTLAHPLNRARFDPTTGKVVAGYTILQPRTEITPVSANQSLFTRIFAGDSGLDLYTHASSDIYQDLFGEGSFVGKGIYDVAALTRSLAGRVPENALLSHDLFEGIQGRAGLVTDIILYEDYPPGFLLDAQRVRRWTRGDWQLLPWLGPTVPTADGGRMANDLGALARWKILDNLRRSLLYAGLLALMAAGWTWLPGSPWVWMVLSLTALAVPLFVPLLPDLARVLQGDVAVRTLVHTARRQALRWLLAVVFLPYEALNTLDAILTALYRMAVSRRRLLQWTTAAHAVRLFGGENDLALSWRQMAGSLLLTLALGALVYVVRPASLWPATPLLAAWLLAPQVAYWISRPAARAQATLTETQQQELRRLARRTWRYFEHFVGPEDRWLAPDHFQEVPLGAVAHRTSSTNLGLMLLSTLAAYDLGYIGLQDLAVRLNNTFQTLGELELYRGHFLNWYDTRSLAPLPPRYVSTVDSGNLAACLIALRQGCLNTSQRAVLRWRRWQGLVDTLDIIDEVVGHLTPATPATVKPLQAQLAEIRQRILAGRAGGTNQVVLLDQLIDASRPELDRRLLTLIETERDSLDAAALRNLRLWFESLTYQVADMQRELQTLLPWKRLLYQPPALFSAGPGAPMAAWQALRAALPETPRLGDIAGICAAGRRHLDALQAQLAALPDPADQVEEARQWGDQLAAALDAAQANAAALLATFGALAGQAEQYTLNMDFGFLYSPERKVFHIGYNVDAEKPDTSYYDLLASEARIASLIAIAKGDVPERHWLQLGRPLIEIEGMRTLLSWSGTMFEYLMPILLMRSYDNTLLDQTIHAVVQHQIEYGRRKGVPWGMSESGYYRFDQHQNYQYRAFGAPELGFKRGLGDDLVVTPYASLLALPIRPQAVMDNLAELAGMGLLGDYGYYEAVDYTPARLAPGQKYAIVRSYMVHHQGMILLSLANYLQDQRMVHRFHADPRIHSAEMLLQEQIPDHAPLEEANHEANAQLPAKQPEIEAAPWRVPVAHAFPQVHYLSNGRFSTLITNGGGGYCRWQDRDLTRWHADTTRDDWGTWVYLMDEERGDVWSVGSQPTATALDQREVQFYPHRADFQCSVDEIAAIMEVTIPPEDDVEIRRIRVTNQSDRPRRVRLCSYAEVTLAPHDTDRRHPAFNKLFIESEYQPATNTLLFRRRARAADEDPICLAHALVVEPGREVTGDYETARARFLGRGGSPRRPAALVTGGPGVDGDQAGLDPIMALGQSFELAPHTTAEVAYLTAAAESPAAALALIGRYRDLAIIVRAFDQARAQSEQEMRRLELTGEELPHIQQLLSLLVYPHLALRAEPEVLAANSQGQPSLWPYAISGDYPILLVRVRSEEETALVWELLRAHAYWRGRGLAIDLVILNQKESGYAQELQGRLYRLLVRQGTAAELNQRGGIFLLVADTMSQADQTLLATAARVMLDGGQGTLAQHLQRLRMPPPTLPAFVPAPHADATDAATPPVARPADLSFDNGWGGFTPDGREYAIYLEPDRWTPAPWSNVVANPDFGFLVTETGGGYTWAGNSGENRLTPWSNDPVRDQPGEALYLRDEETAAVWSPTPLPARADAPYLIRHGAGYSIFEHNSHGLQQQLRLFVAPDAPVKIIHLRIKNIWPRVRRITATYYAEWVLGPHRHQMQQYVIPEYHESHTLLARNPYHPEFGERVAFLTAGQEPHGLTTDRGEFLGRLGDLQQPAGLGRIGLAGTVLPGLDPCAAYQLHLNLAPGEVKEVYFLLGQGEDREHTLQLVKQYQDPAQVEAAWQQATTGWDARLDQITVETPDPAMNLLLNRWLLYQDLACRVWGRTGFYQSSGAFGFRDQLQDVMAVVHTAPEVARTHILAAAGRQFAAGDVLHWWHPPSGRGVRTHISDDLLWLPYVTAHYVAVTGDHAILTEQVPFLVGDPLAAEEEDRYGQYPSTAETFTLYEHCRRALQKGTTAGAHGLPLMGAGDWNDGMNRVGVRGRGESVWLGWFLHAALTDFAPLCAWMGDDAQAEEYRRRAEQLRQALADHAWDGEWYRRAYFDDGAPLGSAANRECRIDAIAQSWAVIAGAGQPERMQQAMEAVNTYLVRPQDGVVLLFTPPFDKTPHDPGYIKGYPPGVRENGGQYTHAALWTAWAFAKLGQGDRAEALFRLLNPIYHGDTAPKAARYGVEPYVVAADVYGEPPYAGRGGWTWYTGSAGWMYRLGVEAILGLRREGQTLWLAPCIPTTWPGYRLTYREGCSRYTIRVENPDGVSQGVVAVSVDGAPVPDGRIPLVDDGQDHAVCVRLGHPPP